MPAWFVAPRLASLGSPIDACSKARAVWRPRRADDTTDWTNSARRPDKFVLASTRDMSLRRRYRRASAVTKMSWHPAVPRAAPPHFSDLRHIACGMRLAPCSHMARDLNAERP